MLKAFDQRVVLLIAISRPSVVVFNDIMPLVVDDGNCNSRHTWTLTQRTAAVRRVASGGLWRPCLRLQRHVSANGTDCFSPTIFWKLVKSHHATRVSTKATVHPTPL